MKKFLFVVIAAALACVVCESKAKACDDVVTFGAGDCYAPPVAFRASSNCYAPASFGYSARAFSYAPVVAFRGYGNSFAFRGHNGFRARAFVSRRAFVPRRAAVDVNVLGLRVRAGRH